MKIGSVELVEFQLGIDRPSVCRAWHNCLNDHREFDSGELHLILDRESPIERLRFHIRCFGPWLAYLEDWYIDQSPVHICKGFILVDLEKIAERS